MLKALKAPAIRKTLAALLLLLSTTAPIHAKTTNQDFMAWTNFRWQHFAKNGLDAFVASSFRFIKNDPGFNQNVTNIGLGYSFTPNLALFAGYTYAPYQGVGRNYFVTEQRSWQQLNWAIIDKKSFGLDLRSWLEQRYFNNRSGTYWRLRELIELDFGGFVDFIPSKLTPIISDELFFNLNSPGSRSLHTLGQNRFFVGLSAPLKKNAVVIQLGYMNLTTFSDNVDNIRHIFQIGLVLM